MGLRCAFPEGSPEGPSSAREVPHEGARCAHRGAPFLFLKKPPLWCVPPYPGVFLGFVFFPGGFFGPLGGGPPFTVFESLRFLWPPFPSCPFLGSPLWGVSLGTQFPPQEPLFFCAIGLGFVLPIP